MIAVHVVLTVAAGIWMCVEIRKWWEERHVQPTQERR
jgi:hypothetical protein